MLFVDLDELPQLVAGGVLSGRRTSLAAFLPSDHFALSDRPQSSKQQDQRIHSITNLRQRITQIVKNETGVSMDGPVRLLTQLRYFGYYFSPLNLYYCYDAVGENVVAVVAEVSNTPWREQHLYVLHDGIRTGTSRHAYAHPKTFHVSPFMEMDLHYRWRLTQPEKTLRIHLSNYHNEQSEPFFAAGMSLSRRPLNRARLARTMLRYPWMTAQIAGGIYFQALKLWWKACPYYPHPHTASNLPQTHPAN